MLQNINMPVRCNTLVYVIHDASYHNKKTGCPKVCILFWPRSVTPISLRLILHFLCRRTGRLKAFLLKLCKEGLES